MDEFILLFRLDITTREKQPSPELLQVYMKQYQEWVSEIAAENKFCSGTALSTEGKVIGQDNVVTDGPFAEVKESIAGYITIRAADFDDAVRLAKGCPILNGAGNTVEVRKIMGANDMKK